MKTQLKKELHNKSLPELRQQVKEANDAYRLLRLDQETGRLKNTSALALKRNEIAVIKTIVNEKTAEEKIAKMTEEGDKKDNKKEKSASAKASADKEGGKK